MSAADRPGSKRPRIRHRWILAVAFLAALPCLLLLAGNLWLCSPWGRSWLAGKISARTGLDARLEAASVTPWGGVCVRGLIIEQPAAVRNQIQQPLVTIASVRAWPVWRSWLHRRWELRSVEIDSPKAVLPVRWLSHLAPSQPMPVPQTTVAAAQPPSAPSFTESRPAAPPPAESLPVIPATAGAPRIPALTVDLAEPPPSAGPGNIPTAWVSIRGGSVAFVSEGMPERLLEVEDLDAAFPIAGGPADSSVAVGRLRTFGADLAMDVRIPLRWQAPILFFGPTNSQLAGLNWRFGGKLGLVPGFPIQVESEIPSQTDRKWNLPSQGECEVREYHSTSRFAGYLRHPLSWQGEAQMEASGVSLAVPGQPAFRFDHGSATLLMANGIVTCPDARLIGDNLSLLGNATAIPDGRAAGVLRIVAEPGYASELVSHFQKSGKRLAFGQLGTPDRLASDISVAANGEGALIQLGQGGEVMSAKDVLQLLRDGARK